MSKCIICEKEIGLFNNKAYLPFCSEHCKNIALEVVSKNNKREYGAAETVGIATRNISKTFNDSNESIKEKFLRKRGFDANNSCPKCGYPVEVKMSGMTSVLLSLAMGKGTTTFYCRNCNWKKTDNELKEEGGVKYN